MAHRREQGVLLDSEGFPVYSDIYFDSFLILISMWYKPDDVKNWWLPWCKFLYGHSTPGTGNNAASQDKSDVNYTVNFRLKEWLKCLFVI